jgi:subtilisin family serine protease
MSFHSNDSLRCVFAAVCAAALLFAATGAASAEPPYVTGEIIFGTASDLSAEDLQQLVDRHGCALKESAAELGIFLATVPASRTAQDVIADLEADTEVKFAHLNYLGRGGDFFPDDTHFNRQWHHYNTGQTGGTPDADIDSEMGWVWTRGSEDVVVAVLDSGIDSDHIEFQGRLVPGYDYVNEDSDPEADHPHGPWVTGLLAANADNGFSVAGVDHFCKVMPIKVLNEFNGGTTMDLIQGINHALNNLADVISMSLINYPGTAGLEQALGTAQQFCVLVACGGNNGIGDADNSWPGASEYTISVGWTEDDDTRYPDSGTGNALDIVAPGFSVATIGYNTDLDVWVGFSGCSAATPIAAGVASLCLSLDPDLTHYDVRDLLIQGAEDQVGPPGEDTPGWDPYFGHGRLNLYNTIALLAPVSVEDGSLLRRGAVLSAAPNPFTQGTAIRLRLSEREDVSVAVYAVDGRLVRTLAGRGVRSGDVSIPWDGTDDLGHSVSPGVYYVRADVGESTLESKIMVVR